MSLQGKGGVGKSFASSVLAQYLMARGNTVRCIDTDPVNKTLHQYQGLGAVPFKLLCDGAIDQRAFDTLVEELITAEGPFVVDNGASTFVPLWQYMLESDVPAILRSAGRRLYLHMVITGGQALADTVSGFANVAATTTEKTIIVWINEFFGPVEFQGRSFREMKAYQEHEEKVCGSVAIPRRNRETFGRDLEELLARKLTFDEAMRESNISLMSRQRLKLIQRGLFEQLDALPLE
jgi:hypothetical protein